MKIVLFLVFLAIAVGALLLALVIYWMSKGASYLFSWSPPDWEAADGESSRDK
jgi:hypothetical protein